MRLNQIAVLLIGGILSLSASVYAEPGGKGEHGDWKKHQAEFEKACGGDVKKYCKDVTKESEDKMKHHMAVMDCLVGHVDTLSDKCKPKVEKMKEMKANMDAVKTACAAEIKEHCKDGEHFMGCLFGHKTDAFSQPCKDAIAKMPEPPHGMHGPK